MNASEIKVKLFQQIDALDKESLEELYGLFMNFIQEKQSSEEWDNLTEIQKKGIENGIYELDAKKGIPGDVVLEELRKKYGIS